MSDNGERFLKLDLDSDGHTGSIIFTVSFEGDLSKVIVSEIEDEEGVRAAIASHTLHLVYDEFRRVLGDEKSDDKPSA